MSCGSDPPGHLPAEGGQNAELLGACWGRGTAAPPRLLPSGAGGGAADKVRKVIAKHPNESTFPIQELCQLHGFPPSIAVAANHLAIPEKRSSFDGANCDPSPTVANPHRPRAACAAGVIFIACWCGRSRALNGSTRPAPARGLPSCSTTATRNLRIGCTATGEVANWMKIQWRPLVAWFAFASSGSSRRRCIAH